MSALTIRKLDPSLKAALRVRAAQHGHSMEEEARQLLRGALAEAPAVAQTGADLADAIHALFAPVGGFPEFEEPPSSQVRSPPDFEA